ncbi:MAG TPA: hypothetical protein VMB52_02975 [Verrucomicrobiae bacterium]|nr:hypothetical protein [Verrucomicrobiae bacterium]
MSKSEITRHQRKGESRAHSQFRKYAMKKMRAVVNHVEYERHHGFESARRGDPVAPVEPEAPSTI